MKILVTGGTGYIGSHTAVELLVAGFEVVLLDNLSNSYAWIADRVKEVTGKDAPLFEVDLADRKAVADFFQQQHAFDGVVHFAALKAVGESTMLPLKYYHNNLFGLIHLLQEMQQHAIPNLVFSSSCTVYGNPDKLPVDESSPVKEAMSPYGNTKRISEDIIRDEVSVSALRCIALRYFNPVGAHPSARLGELPIGIPDNLMPYITQTAIGKRDMLRVFGDDYPTADGTALRDYLHVCDLARAHVIALQRMIRGEQDMPWEVFNLGTGRGYSVLEVIQAFEETNGVKVPYRIAERRPGDIPAIWADTTFANNALGWKATRGMEEMVRTAWEWEKKL